MSHGDATPLVDQVRASRRHPPEVAVAIRKVAGVSQADVARELGVNRVTVARWELGTRRPRGELLVRYCDLLDELSAAAAS